MIGSELKGCGPGQPGEFRRVGVPLLDGDAQDRVVALGPCGTDRAAAGRQSHPAVAVRVEGAGQPARKDVLCARGLPLGPAEGVGGGDRGGRQPDLRVRGARQPAGLFNRAASEVVDAAGHPAEAVEAVSGVLAAEPPVAQVTGPQDVGVGRHRHAGHHGQRTDAGRDQPRPAALAGCFRTHLCSIPSEVGRGVATCSRVRLLGFLAHGLPGVPIRVVLGVVGIGDVDASVLGPGVDEAVRAVDARAVVPGVLLLVRCFRRRDGVLGPLVCPGVDEPLCGIAEDRQAGDRGADDVVGVSGLVVGVGDPCLGRWSLRYKLYINIQVSTAW